jgi:hypothetical protein
MAIRYTDSKISIADFGAWSDIESNNAIEIE